MSPRSQTNNNAAVKLPPWQRALGEFFAQVWVEALVGVLVLISVGLTLLEFSLESGETAQQYAELLHWVSWINHGVTVIFAIELTLRYLAAPSKRRFFAQYWVDIIALLPLLRVFRMFRALRLLRLVRLLRLFGVASRMATHFPYILRRGAVEFITASGLIVITVLFGTTAIIFFEGHDAEAASVDEAFWFSVYSLFAGEPIPAPPVTLGGKLAAVVVMFMGLTVFAMFTGTVAAFMVERLQTEGDRVDWELLKDHIIICGWNSRTEIVVKELRASELTRYSTIVIIAEFGGEKPLLSAEIERNVMFIDDDFTRVPVLEKAGIERASSCIILSDTHAGRNEQDSDARTILGALTVERMNPNVYTCAELYNPDYAAHLRMGNVDDYVVSGEYGAYVLAHAAMHRGSLGVFTELLTYQHGNEFYRLKAPKRYDGKSFLEAMIDLKENHQAILIAVHSPETGMKINPQDCQIAEGDEIVVIAEGKLELGE